MNEDFIKLLEIVRKYFIVNFEVDEDSFQCTLGKENVYNEDRIDYLCSSEGVSFADSLIKALNNYYN